MEGVTKIELGRTQINAGIDIVSFLADTGILPSRGEARKMVLGGGISINRKKVDQIDFMIDASLLLHNRYILAQKGKKNYYQIIVTD